MHASFSFAGFQFPRQVPRLVAPSYCGLPAPLARMSDRYNAADKRNADDYESGDTTAVRRAKPPRLHRFKVSTSYSTAPEPVRDRASRSTSFSFYLASDFAPGLRWTWADKCEDVRIDHTGWFSDDDGSRETMRGLVLRLPHGRGFLAGWSMGEEMTATVERDIIEDEKTAAYRADRIAEIAAEHEREYQAKYEAAERARELLDDIKRERADRRRHAATLRAVLTFRRNNPGVPYVGLSVAEARRRVQAATDRTTAAHDELEQIHETYGADIAAWEG